jgi:selenocysteine lyase/cysteine desulfurase
VIHEEQKAHVSPVCGGAEVRALFPVTERLVYLNHAAISPPPTTTIRAIEAQLRDVHERGSLNFRSWVQTKERTRELLANLLGARAEQVGFVRNTSDGLSTVANGIKWRSGDNIVTLTTLASKFACARNGTGASISRSLRG